MVIIDFLDYNILDTLILVTTIRPDKLYLVADNDDFASKRTRHIIAAIKHINGTINVVEVGIDTNNIVEAVNAVNDISKRERSELYINIDADHGISTAASYGRAGQDGAVPICVDLQHEVIRNLETLEVISNIKHIRLQDFLVAIGAKRLEGSHDLPAEEEYGRVVNVAETLFKSVNVWNMLCGYIGQHYSHNSNVIRIPDDLGGKARGRQINIVRSQLRAFCENGFINKLDGKVDGNEDLYKFVNERYKNYMLVYGIWLEMYIYIKFKPYFEEMHCGYVIDWDNADGFDTKDNEIDVICMKKSRPILISCKMRMPTKEDIYEIGYLAEMIGGTIAIPAIATTASINRKESYKPGLYPRFRKMQVGLIETSEMQTVPLEDIVERIKI